MTENLKEATPTVSLVSAIAETELDSGSPFNSTTYLPSQPDADSQLKARSEVACVPQVMPDPQIMSEPHCRSSFDVLSDTKLPDVPLPKQASEFEPATAALKTLLGDKRFLRASVAVLTAMCVVIGLYATNRSESSFDLRDPFSGIKHSDTVDGYINQAQILDAKGNHAALIDGWQKALECAKNQHYKPMELGKLYVDAGDKLSHVNQDGFAYVPYNAQSSSDRNVAKGYYKTAISLFQKENNSRLELMTRYRIAVLQRDLIELDKQANLRAILELEKNHEVSKRVIDINYELGEQCELEGQHDEAAKYLLYAIKYDSADILRDREVGVVCTILRSQKKYGELIRLLKNLEQRRFIGEIQVTPSIYLLQQLRTTYEAVDDTTSVSEVNKAINSVLNN